MLQLLGKTAQSSGTANQPVTGPLSQRLPIWHILQVWRCPAAGACRPRVPLCGPQCSPRVPCAAPTATPELPALQGSPKSPSVLLPAPRCVRHGLLPWLTGSSQQPRELKTAVIVFAFCSEERKHRATARVFLLSSLAPPILLLPPLCYSMSYHFLPPILPDDCTRHGLKIVFQRRNIFATMEAKVNKNH